MLTVNVYLMISSLAQLLASAIKLLLVVVISTVYSRKISHHFSNDLYGWLGHAGGSSTRN